MDVITVALTAGTFIAANVSRAARAAMITSVEVVSSRATNAASCLATAASMKKKGVTIAMKKNPKKQPTNKPMLVRSVLSLIPVLRFSPTAWAKLLFLRDSGETEVGGFGIAASDDLLLVEDVRRIDLHAQ